MRRASKIALLFSFLVTIPAFSQSDGSIHVPITWFEEGERHADHWKVEIEQPFLTYSQRFTIRVVAQFPVGKGAPTSRTDLHLVARVSDANGKWYPSYDHSHIEIPSDPKRKQLLAWSTDIFVRPGSYRVALLAYDLKTNQHYLWRKAVTVEKPELLPELDRNFPEVEFFEPERIHPPIGEELPIHNRHPVRVDIVMNLTGDNQMSVSPRWYRWVRQWAVQSALMGSVSALSQLRPDNGCVRLSAIDIIHTEVARDRAVADARDDWQKVRETIRKNGDTRTVDVRTLAGRKKAREFFRHFLEQVISDKTGCGEGMEDVDRAVVVVSDSLEFPAGSENEPVASPPESGTRFYHVKISSRYIPTYDQVGHMLGSLHPRQFNVNDPNDLRNALAKLIKDLEKNGATEAQAH